MALTKEESKKRAKQRKEEQREKEEKAEKEFPSAGFYDGDHGYTKTLQVYLDAEYPWHLTIRYMGKTTFTPQHGFQDYYVASIPLNNPGSIARFIRALAARYNHMIRELNQEVAHTAPLEIAEECTVNGQELKTL